MAIVVKKPQEKTATEETTEVVKETKKVTTKKVAEKTPTTSTISKKADKAAKEIIDGDFLKRDAIVEIVSNILNESSKKNIDNPLWNKREISDVISAFEEVIQKYGIDEKRQFIFCGKRASKSEIKGRTFPDVKELGYNTYKGPHTQISIKFDDGEPVLRGKIDGSKFITEDGKKIDIVTGKSAK